MASRSTPLHPPFLCFSPLLLPCPLFSAPLFLTPLLFPGLLASGELPSSSPGVCPASQAGVRKPLLQGSPGPQTSLGPRGQDTCPQEDSQSPPGPDPPGPSSKGWPTRLPMLPQGGPFLQHRSSVLRQAGTCQADDTATGRRPRCSQGLFITSAFSFHSSPGTEVLASCFP